jgi:anti-anti-sigma factor
MFNITVGANNELILAGRFDASEVDKARPVLLAITEGRTIDLQRLDYISSAGLGVLLAVQKKLSESGASLKLVNVNSHIKDLLFYSGLDQVFEVS